MSRTGHLVYGTMLVTILSFHVMSTARQTAGVPEAFQSALVRHTGNHANVTWLGAPIWQSVLDVWILQEALSEVRPGC